MDSITAAVISKIVSRAELGLKKYGVNMEQANLSRAEWLKHAQEEALDFAVYLEKLIQEEKKQMNEFNSNANNYFDSEKKFIKLTSETDFSDEELIKQLSKSSLSISGGFLLDESLRDRPNPNIVDLPMHTDY